MIYILLFSMFLTGPEEQLLQLINQQRSAFSLPRLTINPELQKVAMLHAIDFVERVKTGSGHTWSDGCVDTECTKRKPMLLSGYKSFAYEIAHYHYPGPERETCTPECALKGWNSSPPHYNIIVNNETWKDYHWKSVGIAIYKGYACVWFGQE